MNDTNVFFRKEVLLNALKRVIASTQVAISEGTTDVSKLIYITNYNVAISLQSFCIFKKRKITFTKKIDAINSYNNIFYDCYKDAIPYNPDLVEYFSFRDDYDSLNDDEKLIITAMLSLSSYFSKKTINKIKNILKEYTYKLKNCIKNAEKYYPFFNTSIVNYYNILCLLFRFLIESS